MGFATAPFPGTAVARAALGEPMVGVQLGAGVLLGAALALLLGDRHAHAHAHEAVEHTHSHRHDDGHHTHSHPKLPPEAWHTHAHQHEAAVHTHPDAPDLHHRHGHG